MPIKDKTGQRYGALVVVRHSHSVYRSPRHGYYQYWLCKCDCGNGAVVLANNLNNGNTTSCGCLGSRRTIGDRARKHGLHGTPIESVWRGMIARCKYQSSPSWRYYGARGIKVCERWLKLENFHADMGDRPEGSSLDRIDVDGDYEPSNCRWATSKEQGRNRKTNRWLAHAGERLTLVEWSERTGIADSAIRARIDDLGWSVKRALTTPSRRKNRGHEKGEWRA